LCWGVGRISPNVTWGRKGDWRKYHVFLIAQQQFHFQECRKLKLDWISYNFSLSDVEEVEHQRPTVSPTKVSTLLSPTKITADFYNSLYKNANWMKDAKGNKVKYIFTTSVDVDVVTKTMIPPLVAVTSSLNEMLPIICHFSGPNDFHEAPNEINGPGKIGTQGSNPSQSQISERGRNSKGLWVLCQPQKAGLET